MTAAEQAILVDLLTHGEPQVWNGRARRTIESLYVKGLVLADFDIRRSYDRHQTQRIFVSLTDRGRKEARRLSGQLPGLK